MPALLGAGSEFIPADNLPAYPNEVIKLDALTSDSTLLGYVYGGINSTEPNIFWVNDGTQSSASNEIFKVFLIKNTHVGVDELNTQSTGSLHLQVYPNPNDGAFILKFNLKDKTKIRLIISDMNGKVLEESVFKQLNKGENTLSRTIENLSNGGIYFITVETSYEKATQKIIIEP